MEFTQLFMITITRNSTKLYFTGGELEEGEISFIILNNISSTFESSSYPRIREIIEIIFQGIGACK